QVVDYVSCAGSGQKFTQLSQQLTLTLGPHQALLRRAILEDDERGDAHDVVAAGDVWILVDVQLGDADLARMLAGDLIEDRGDHFARSAPLGTEVDDHRLGRGANRLVERGVGEGGYAFNHVQVTFLWCDWQMYQRTRGMNSAPARVVPPPAGPLADH